MRIAIIGFGKVARKLIDTIKTFPEYHRDDMRIYAVHTYRNTLSYGSDLVVEIPDPHGDGYRTYKDGLQSTDLCTRVSNYEEWLLDESNRGAFDHVFMATPYNESSTKLLYRLLKDGKSGTTFYLMNKDLVRDHWESLVGEAALKGSNISFNAIALGIEDYEKVDINRATIKKYVEDPRLLEPNSLSSEDIAAGIIKEIRRKFDIGSNWTPKTLPEEYLKDAEERWLEEEKEMARLHIVTREKIIDRTKTMLETGEYERDSNTTAMFPDALTNDEVETLYRFVVGGEGDYFRKEWYDESRKCLVIEHEMLLWFYGEHKMDDMSASAFLRSDLRTTSARYYKYDSEESYVEEHVESPKCGYVIEYALTSEEFWPIYLEMEEDPESAMGKNDALAYTSQKVSRDRLSTTKNKSVEIVIFHLAPSVNGMPAKCECYE